jgi:hypothetical protein
MPIHKTRMIPGSVHRSSSSLAANAWRGCLLFCMATLVLALAGCSEDPALDSMQSDANGFMCTSCGAKFYTARKDYMEAQCPKCDQYTVQDVIGYNCVKCKHITLRPKVAGPAGAAICEKCGAHLQNAMVSPRQTDLVAWGAVKYNKTK